MTTRCFSPPLNVAKGAQLECRRAGGGKRFPRDRQIVCAFELERTEVRVSPHQHDLDRAEVERRVRLLRHDGDAASQLAA